MNQPISKSEIFELFLEACPDARAAYEEHLEDYGDEADEFSYLGIAVFARHVVELTANGKTESFNTIFDLVERLIIGGNEQVQGLAIVGFLEGLQNISSWTDFGPGVFVPWLRPQSLVEWNQLDATWEGKTSLAEVLRSELKS